MQSRIIVIDVADVRALLARTQTPAKEFAARVGISYSHMSNILRGTFGISRKVAPNFLRVCEEIEAEYEQKRRQEAAS